MKARAFVFNLIINIIVNAIISFVISGIDCILSANAIADPAMKPAVFNPQAFIAPTICGTIVGTVFCMIVPINDVATKFAVSNGAKPGEPMHNFYKFIVFVLVMVFVESFCCHMILYYFGFNPMFPADTIASPVDWLVPIPSYYLPAYIFAITSFPVAFAIAAKISGFDPRKLPQEGKPEGRQK